MRLFIAFQFNDEMRSALTAMQDELRRRGVRGNFTRPENLHLTLAFIGEQPGPDQAMEAMETVRFDPVPLRLDGVGAFGELWWAGITGSGELNAAVSRLRRALADKGVPFDKKRFSPHITLVRKPRYGGIFALASLNVPPVRMTAERMSLMLSTRGRDGMIYTELGGVDAE